MRDRILIAGILLVALVLSAVLFRGRSATVVRASGEGRTPSDSSATNTSPALRTATPSLIVESPIPSDHSEASPFVLDTHQWVDRAESKPFHQDPALQRPSADSTSPATRRDFDSALSQPTRGPPLVVFYHVPKTGGESICGFGRSDGATVGMNIRSQKAYEDSMPLLAKICEGRWEDIKMQQRVFVEIHAGDAPSFNASIDDFLLLKQTCVRPVIIMTVLREPLSWYRSAFEYVCGGVQNELCGPHTSKNMAIKAHSNPQCAYLLYGWGGYVHPKGQASNDDCALLWARMVRNIDWIGTTASLEDTWRFLSRLGFPGEMVWKNRFVPKKPAGDPTESEQLVLASKSGGDQYMYDAAESLAGQATIRASRNGRPNAYV